MAALAQWAIPIATLAFVPKCPMCVAAYIVFFTGIGLSLPVAAAVRWALVMLSIVALAYLVIRHLYLVAQPGKRIAASFNDRVIKVAE